VPGDMVVEQTVTPVSGRARVFHLHYRVSHLGSDLHASARQELPAVYVNASYNHFVYYGGAAPWTNGAVSVTQFGVPPAASALLYAPEHWGAHVDTESVGLTVYVPSQYPYESGVDFPGAPGPTGNGTNYFSPLTALPIGPNFVFEGDVYLIAGVYVRARQIFYAPHKSVTAPAIFTPVGSTDVPAGGSTITGVAAVGGWTFGAVTVSKVEILVDGTVDGTASYGSPRP